MAVSSSRSIARNQEWRVVKITEVNPTTQHIAAEDQYGTPMLIDVTGQAALLQIPVVGELWTVSRRGSDWLLERRYENPDTKLSFTDMNPGDVRVEASGAISIYGTSLKFNGVDVDTGLGSGVVTSVFTRTGDVIATTGDYTVTQITGAAPLASPTFTGDPKAPTPTAGDNDTSIATTAFVHAAIVGAASPPTKTVLAAGTSGTYTVPANCIAIFVECIGGGGGSPGLVINPTNAGVATGGGGGAYAAKLITSPSATYAYSVAATSSGAGNNTTFGTTIVVAQGGSVGGAYAANAFAVFVGGARGTASGSTGDFTIGGSDGGSATIFSATSLTPAFGGGAARGGGNTSPPGGTTNQNGLAGSSPGGGAAGGWVLTSGTISGASGAGGLIVITEYY